MRLDTEQRVLIETAEEGKLVVDVVDVVKPDWEAEKVYSNLSEEDLPKRMNQINSWLFLTGLRGIINRDITFESGFNHYSARVILRDFGLLEKVEV